MNNNSMLMYLEYHQLIETYEMAKEHELSIEFQKMLLNAIKFSELKKVD
ncbi:hypothetical protein [Paenibacillus psychroresistens]|nr:hypothetical protein [Paenibacillus psychroresistens]